MSRRPSLTYIAYLCLLLSFVALGTFVYALAVDSYLAGAVGGALAVLLVAAAYGFRAGARTTAATHEGDTPLEGANIWAQPVKTAQIARYLAAYRPIAVQKSEIAARQPSSLPERRAA